MSKRFYNRVYMAERRKRKETNDNVTLYESNRDMYIDYIIMNNTSPDTSQVTPQYDPLDEQISQDMQYNNRNIQEFEYFVADQITM